MPDPIDAIGAAATVAEATIPVLTPFSPIISLVLGIVKAHYNATKGQFPTAAEVEAAFPADVQQLTDLWAAWSQSKGKPMP